jgi:two-component system alkaline phosphatase synthesis response regulator PhoP
MPLKILVIDDEPNISDVIRLILQSEGYSVICANSGEEGLKLAKKELPQGIVLDVMMPKMSGYLVANLLGKDETTKKIPILFLVTASSQPMVGGNISLEMQTPYKLVKPFKPDELIKAVIKMMRGINDKDYPENF